MNVLLIMEDFINDQFILIPLVKKMLEALGRPRAKVKPCTSPRIQGVSQAMHWPIIEKILNVYMQFDVILLCVDRDGEKGRRVSLDRLEEQARALLADQPNLRVFLAMEFWQEVEIVALAGQERLDGDWKGMREEISLKETYFTPLAKQRGLHNTPGNGRKNLGEEAASNYPRVRQLCPEDVASLETRLRQSLS